MPTASRKTPRLSQILSPDAVLIAPAGLDKNGLLELLIKRLCAVKELPSPETFLAKVLEREHGISTTLDTGLSLPHARVDNLPDIVAAMAIVPKGIPDPMQAGLSIRVMFLFFSPNKQEYFPQHLQLLRGVACLFQPSFIDRLTGAASAAEALELVGKTEA